jgi:hypothetical protein
MVDTTNIGETETTTEDTQASVTKTYTQKEVDDMMARTKSAVARKYEKQYGDLGDPEELRSLKTAAEKARDEQALKRGEFDRVIQELANKKDAEIQKRDKIIQEYKIDLPLTSAAAQFKAVNAEQVKALLKNQVRLNEFGDIEVIDQKGQLKVNGKGQNLTVEELVKDFLDSNPHFVSPTPATTHTKSSHQNFGSGKVDLSKLDMTRSEDRQIYARETGKIKT